MTDAVRPWPTLAEFLDAGGDPSLGWGRWGMLLEFLVNDVASKTPAARDRLATQQEWWSRLSLDEAQEQFPMAPGHERSAEQHFNTCRQLAWEAEALRDSALAARLLAAAPAGQDNEYRRKLDVWKRPYPILVEPPILRSPGLTHWNCEACGTAFDPDVDAIIITDRPNHSELPHDLNYCRECIAMALAAYDAGRSTT